MNTTVVRLDRLPGLVGRELGPSSPVEMGQERIDAFADCTLDRQWIHTDPVRAAASPAGTTVAHGFLTLSMLSWVMDELLRVEGITMAINYGLDRVRFTAPVRTGSLVRGRVGVRAVEPAAAHTMMRARVTFDTGDPDRPCCVADSVTRYVAAA